MLRWRQSENRFPQGPDSLAAHTGPPSLLTPGALRPLVPAPAPPRAPGSRSVDEAAKRLNSERWQRCVRVLGGASPSGAWRAPTCFSSSALRSGETAAPRCGPRVGAGGCTRLFGPLMRRASSSHTHTQGPSPGALHAPRPAPARRRGGGCTSWALCARAWRRGPRGAAAGSSGGKFATLDVCARSVLCALRRAAPPTPRTVRAAGGARAGRPPLCLPRAAGARSAVCLLRAACCLLRVCACVCGGARCGRGGRCSPPGPQGQPAAVQAHARAAPPRECVAPCSRRRAARGSRLAARCACGASCRAPRPGSPAGGRGCGGRSGRPPHERGGHPNPATANRALPLPWRLQDGGRQGVRLLAIRGGRCRCQAGPVDGRGARQRGGARGSPRGRHI